MEKDHSTGYGRWNAFWTFHRFNWPNSGCSAGVYFGFFGGDCEDFGGTKFMSKSKGDGCDSGYGPV